jgi:formiminotetrahydrofolate cyclodeaminase
LLAARSAAEWLDALAAETRAGGGGSTASLCAIAAGLVEMAVNFASVARAMRVAIL